MADNTQLDEIDIVLACKIDIVFAWMEGNCPIQAEGTFGGKEFYFRARWNSMRVYVGGIVKPEFLYEEPYDEDGPGSAGWAPKEDCLAFIRRAFAAYVEAGIEKEMLSADVQQGPA